MEKGGRKCIVGEGKRKEKERTPCNKKEEERGGRKYMGRKGEETGGRMYVEEIRKDKRSGEMLPP